MGNKFVVRTKIGMKMIKCQKLPFYVLYFEGSELMN